MEFPAHVIKDILGKHRNSSPNFINQVLLEREEAGRPAAA